MNQPCENCGDSYKMKQAVRNLAREQAQQKANETKEPYAVCQEANGYFAAAYRIALENRFHIIEIVPRLQDTVEDIP